MTVLLAQVLGSAMIGAVAVELVRWLRERRQDRRIVDRADLDLFYPTWKEEMRRLTDEVHGLRSVVVALSEEVQRLGGDPLAIRIRVEPPPEGR